MNYHSIISHQGSSQLLARNEGKIKSFDSCCDIRAWSHDQSAKDNYLREWMKKDMPICVIPISVLTNFLRIMTCKSRRRVTPRCHPDCKSKVVLESICCSCEAMKKCLEGHDSFDKYFVEEELETSHWPCDKCLDALKSIKLFWKIIVGKILNINVFKFEEFSETTTSCDNVKSVVKLWQNEMLNQALYVKNISTIKNTSTFTKICPYNADTNKTQSARTVKSCPPCDKKFENNVIKTTVSARPSDQEPLKIKEKRLLPKKNLKKLNKTTNTEVKISHHTSVSCSFNAESDEIRDYKKNIELLQNKCHLQNEEMERLRIENRSLKVELENIYKSRNWNAQFFNSDMLNRDCLPKPFEAGMEDNCTSPLKIIDSEMIITMKNCKNENFKHVSLLQVLHKTNDPLQERLNNDDTSKRKDDPLEILTKVQNTFGAIVRRELNFLNEKKQTPMKGDVIDGLFHRVNATRSAPSCSTLSSKYNSEYHFGSTKGDKM